MRKPERRKPAALVMLSSHSGPAVWTPHAAFSTETFAGLYFALDEAGISPVVATPAGGQPSTTWVEGTTTGTPMPDRFRQDIRARNTFADSLMIEQIFAADFDAVIVVSATDGLWDLVRNETATRIVDELMVRGCPVVLIGHAPVILCRSLSADQPARGRDVTGVSRQEDRIACPAIQLPLHVQDSLITAGAHYNSGPPWQPFVIEDGSLITGQNMASVDLAVNALLRIL